MGPDDGEDDVVGIGEYVWRFVKYKETKNSLTITPYETLIQ